MKLLSSIRDICFLLGFTFLSYGLWLIYNPAMFIVLGLFFIYLGIPPQEGGD